MWQALRRMKLLKIDQKTRYSLFVETFFVECGNEQKRLDFFLASMIRYENLALSLVFAIVFKLQFGISNNTHLLINFSTTHVNGSIAHV